MVVRLKGILLAHHVFKALDVIRIRHVGLTGRGNFGANLMALLHCRVDFLYGDWLLHLVVRVLRWRRGILVRICLFLASSKGRRFAITLNGPGFAPTFSPIRGEGLGTSLRGLIVLRVLMGDERVAVLSNVPRAYGRVSTARIATYHNRFVVDFRLSTAGILDG